MLLSLKFVLLSSPLFTMALMSFPIAKPGCKTQCGSLTVEYPFGIGPGSNCSLDSTFDILTCDSTNYNPPKLFYKNIEIYNISGFEFRVKNWIAVTCYNQSGVTKSYYVSVNLAGTPFTLSQKNKFTVVGCDDYALIDGTNGGDFSTGCFGYCNAENDVPDGYCSGIGCCETSIPKGLKFYNATLLSLHNHANVFSFNPCGFAFLGEEQSFQLHGGHDLFNDTELGSTIEGVPIVLEWVIGGNKSCNEATECKGNSLCDPYLDGYRCSCKEGYEGNPYLDPGCQDINECDDKSNKSVCYGHCINTLGSYNCTCPQGYKGNANTPDGCQPFAKPSKFPVLIFTLSLVFGLGATVSGLIAVLFGIRKRKLNKLKKKFFEKNGGLFLQQKLNAPGTSEAVIMFSTEQLMKATNNYSEDRIIGRGSNGVVYKGILADKSVVAIKKSKLVDGTQAEQFINEVLNLTQVIHRNVVKLLGFCLEEEVPVLVYEFIANNTLYYHLHHKSNEMSSLSWENRLKVATEAADALGYLHSQVAMPIIHRDVKSTNILLDENYITKISDFGASRLVPLDHEQVTTLVQGTLGYLDPEYFHTSQLTEKSDVYSFGVVLAELITGQKPLCVNRTNDEKNLATYFVKAMKEDRLFEIVEPRVLCEASHEQIQQVADLAKRCVYLQGVDRPTMKEVAMELECLKKVKTHSWVQQQTDEEYRSLILDVDRSADLFEVPSIRFTEWESYIGSSNYMGLPETKPR